MPGNEKSGITRIFNVINRAGPDAVVYFSNNLSFGTTFTFVPSFSVLLIAV